MPPFLDPWLKPVRLFDEAGEGSDCRRMECSAMLTVRVKEAKAVGLRGLFPTYPRRCRSMVLAGPLRIGRDAEIGRDQMQEEKTMWEGQQKKRDGTGREG